MNLPYGANLLVHEIRCASRVTKNICESECTNATVVPRSSLRLRPTTLLATSPFRQADRNQDHQVWSNPLLCVPFLQPMKWAQLPRSCVLRPVSVSRLLLQQTKMFRPRSPPAHCCRAWRMIARKAQRHAHARP
jgi:hypothetical protein